MNKKGFTLIELLGVIALIAILSVLIVPNIMNVNKNMNNRLYNKKKENILAAAELYGSNNPDIFKGSDTAIITVLDLLEADYLKPDSYEKEECGEDDSKAGCVIDSRNDATIKSMNGITIILTKEMVGITAEFEETTGAGSESNTLVNKVCEGFYLGTYGGKYDLDKACSCKIGADDKPILYDVKTNATVDSCIIVSNNDSGDVNNWLKYGDSKANWRVVGLYKVNGDISAKLITSGLVE